ncbi:hypothetical protein [Nonomuraea sp. NPDC049709]|uniref:hypothetical protein n=1 Tax=Nonomuraea sp. NPDC049709 TaxID=3154736 RepID=UPI0034405D5F
MLRAARGPRRGDHAGGYEGPGRLSVRERDLETVVTELDEAFGALLGQAEKVLPETAAV